MKRTLLASAAVLAILILPGGLFAHHGNSAYDEQHPITISGTVTEFVWSNPHSQIYLDVKGANGNIVHWSIKTNSPGILIRDGWRHSSLKPGDQISITLIPARNGAPVGYAGGGYNNALKVVFADGQNLTFTDKEK